MGRMGNSGVGAQTTAVNALSFLPGSQLAARSFKLSACC